MPYGDAAGSPAVAAGDAKPPARCSAPGASRPRWRRVIWPTRRCRAAPRLTSAPPGSSASTAPLPFDGIIGKVAPASPALYADPIALCAFAFLAGKDSVKRLIGGMGSRIDRDGVRHSAAPMGNPGHVAAALGMMIHWNLAGLARDLPVPLKLVTAATDSAVPPATAAAVRKILRSADVVALKGVGHLAHPV